MELNYSLIDKMAKITNDSSKPQSLVLAYGEVFTNKQTNQRYVTIDGSQNTVPISIATDAQTGDRVLVQIQNHQAIVVGNLSTPASARTATDYMRFTEDGLYIGKLDPSGEPTDAYTLINAEAMKVCAEGVTWAIFGKDGTQLYDNEKLVASFNKEYVDINKGIRLIDEKGDIHPIISVDYEIQENDDSSSYFICNIGDRIPFYNLDKEPENIEYLDIVSIHARKTSVDGSLHINRRHKSNLLIESEYLKNEFSGLLSAPTKKRVNGFYRDIDLLESLSLKFFRSDYISSIITDERDYSIFQPCHLFLQKGIYIVTCMVVFKETQKTAGVGWRLINIMADTNATTEQEIEQNELNGYTAQSWEGRDASSSVNLTEGSVFTTVALLEIKANQPIYPRIVKYTGSSNTPINIEVYMRAIGTSLKYLPMG